MGGRARFRWASRNEDTAGFQIRPGDLEQCVNRNAARNDAIECSRKIGAFFHQSLGSTFRDLHVQMEFSCNRPQEGNALPPRFDERDPQVWKHEVQRQPRDPSSGPDVRQPLGIAGQQSGKQQGIAKKSRDHFARALATGQVVGAIPPSEQSQVGIEALSLERVERATQHQSRGRVEQGERIAGR